MNGSSEAPPTSRLRMSEERDEDNAEDTAKDEETPRVNGLTNGCSGGVTDNDTAEIHEEEEEENEENECSPPPMKELSPEELAEKMKMVHRLQVELRNEEMKLVLLKKLRQSQVR